MATASRTYLDVYEGEQGETIRLASLSSASIFIPDFQRERKPHHRRILAEFDRTAYVIPIVMAFNDEYVCLDGQQRLAALQARGEVDAVVLLIEGVASETRAAELYLRYNRDRLGLNAFEKFVGAHAARDPGTLDQARILQACGLRAAASAAKSSDGVPAGAITSIYMTYGADVLQRVLEIRELAWGDANDHESRESRTLKGLATFIRSYFDKVDDGVLVDVLRKQHPASLLSKVEGSRGSFESRYSDYVRDLYNRRFPRGRGRL